MIVTPRQKRNEPGLILCTLNLDLNGQVLVLVILIMLMVQV